MIDKCKQFKSYENKTSIQRWDETRRDDTIREETRRDKTRKNERTLISEQIIWFWLAYFEILKMSCYFDRNTSESIRWRINNGVSMFTEMKKKITEITIPNWLIQFKAETIHLSHKKSNWVNFGVWSKWIKIVADKKCLECQECVK